jgi:L-lactate utilization protein LutB
VLAAVDHALKPWKRQQDIEEAIQQARQELPFRIQRVFDSSPPTEWEARATERARQNIAMLPADAPLAAVQAAATQGAREVVAEYNAEEARARAEREATEARKASEREADFSLYHVDPYLAKLEADPNGWTFDAGERYTLAPKIKKAIRPALIAKLCQESVGISGANKLVEGLVDAWLEKTYSEPAKE